MVEKRRRRRERWRGKKKKKKRKEDKVEGGQGEGGGGKNGPVATFTNRVVTPDRSTLVQMVKSDTDLEGNTARWSRGGTRCDVASFVVLGDRTFYHGSCINSGSLQVNFLEGGRAIILLRRSCCLPRWWLKRKAINAEGKKDGREGGEAPWGRRGGSALFDLYRPSRSTNDWAARSNDGPAIASPSYFHVACSRFQWRRGPECLSMGHLPFTMIVGDD